MKKLSINITMTCVFLLMQPQAMGGEPLRIYTVNYPLQYFAQRIAGEHAEVMLPTPADVDPAFWQPDIETILAYQRADLVLLNGAGYARWVDNVSLPPSRLVNTSAGFSDKYIDIEATTTHSHGPGGDHSHSGTAFTTWLDFNQAIQQAGMIRDALLRKRPELDEIFEQNYKKLKHDLQALDDQLKSIALTNTRQPLLASHPVYQYLSRRYGLRMESFEWEPNVEPAKTQFNELQLLLKEHRAEWMLWEGQPLQSSIDKLQSIGVGSVVFDPCGNRPEQGDFLTVMQDNVQRLRQIQQER
jgi:zinc transport system substrate-binding protein